MSYYKRYQKTIKEVAKKNYNRRIIWLNEFLAPYCCHHCGEPETACLKFYPHDREIRYKSKRLGLNEESRKEVKDFIEKSKVVCANCYLKLDNDLIDIM